MFEIGDFLLAAEAALGVPASRLRRITNRALAESALAAPYACFGGHDLYNHPIQRAAILAARLMQDHPLPDGNKRVALVLMYLYLEDEGYRLTATPPQIDRTFRAVAGKTMTEDQFTIWLGRHTKPVEAKLPLRGGV